jgi:lipopolysaccharide/colanic/teichoic acid biosynthesis glycosyltransferase
MSLVGPRPNVPYEVEAYKEWHMERLSVLPGITGLAQVKGRSALDFDTIARYDIEYARRMSIVLDVRILLATAFAVVKGNGAG